MPCGCPTPRAGWPTEGLIERPCFHPVLVLAAQGVIDWLGIGHLFELSGTEAIAGFFTPLVIFAAFFLAQLILPGRWVPGYVINPETRVLFPNRAGLRLDSLVKSLCRSN